MPEGGLEQGLAGQQVEGSGGGFQGGGQVVLGADEDAAGLQVAGDLADPVADREALAGGGVVQAQVGAVELQP